MCKISKVVCIEGRQFLRFKPPGYEDYLELPVITSGSRDINNAWTWNGSLDKPTLKPSIKTKHSKDGPISHFWLNNGMCKFLSDTTTESVGKILPLEELQDG